jgi:branched-subunit amino acid aminotransferase/4-amino-4-deoxychorismate lyase
VTEQELWPEELLGAEEVFLTSTLREILPVTRVDERTVGQGQPGPVTEKLRALFRELTRPGERPTGSEPAEPVLTRSSNPSSRKPL